MTTQAYPDIASIGASRGTAPIFGRGGFSPFKSGQEQPEQTGNVLRRPDDSTGLSISPEELQEKVAAFAKEQEATAHERAYREAGREAGRQTGLSTGMSPVFSGGEAAAEASRVSSQATSQNPLTTTPQTPEESKPANAESRSPVSSGGDEERSAERTFMGGVAAAQPQSEERAPGRAGRKDAKDGQQSAEEKAEEEGEGGMNAELTEEEEQQVREMKERDREVRTHEQAHISAGGSIVAGGASYETETGPDGKSYATGGEVQIDTSKGSNPDDTISKARKIKQAALAPAEPSGQDRKVAAKASQMETEARQEKAAEAKEDGGKGASGNGTDGEVGAVEDAEKTGENSKSSAAGMERLSAQAAQKYTRASGAELPAPYGMTRSFAV